MSYRRNLPLLLLSVRELVRAHFQPTFRRYEITEQQWRIMRLLYERPGLGVGEIADNSLIFRPSIVGIVSRMEETGVVYRESVPHDKRRASIHLTRRGKTMVEEIFPIFEGIYQELEIHVSKSKMDELFEVLEEISGILSDMPINDSSTTKSPRQKVRLNKA